MAQSLVSQVLLLSCQVSNHNLSELSQCWFTPWHVFSDLFWYPRVWQKHPRWMWANLSNEWILGNYICIHIYIYIHMFTYVYLYIHIYRYGNVYIYIYMYIYIYVCVAWLWNIEHSSLDTGSNTVPGHWSSTSPKHPATALWELWGSSGDSVTLNRGS